jgi:hypothetical protein
LIKVSRLAGTVQPWAVTECEQIRILQQRHHDCPTDTLDHDSAVATRTLTDILTRLDPRFSPTFRKTQLEYIIAERDEDGLVHCLESYLHPTREATCPTAFALAQQNFATRRPKRKPSHPRQGRFGAMLVTRSFSVAAFTAGPVCPDCLGGPALTRVLALATHRGECTDALYKIDLAWRSLRLLDEVARTTGDLVKPERYVRQAARLDELIVEYAKIQPISAPWLRDCRDELSTARDALTTRISNTPSMLQIRQARLTERVRRALTPNGWPGSPISLDVTPVILAASYATPPFHSRSLSAELCAEFAIAGSNRVLVLPRFCAEYLLIQLPSTAVPPPPDHTKYSYTARSSDVPSDRLNTIARVVPLVDPLPVVEVAATLYDPHGHNELSDFASCLEVARSTCSTPPPKTAKATKSTRSTRKR